MRRFAGDAISLSLDYQRKRCAIYLIFLVALMFFLPLPSYAGSDQKLGFQCPRAYQGIKSSMLPTYWEPTDQGKNIRARQSHVQGKYMICIYRESTGKQIGNVRRLIPKGYQCITGGRGAFQCSRRKK